MSTYDVDDGLRSTVTFTVGETPTDPTTIEVKVRKPDGTVSDRSANKVHDSDGVYHLDVFPDAPGAWVVRWKGTGTATAVFEESFTVRPEALTGHGLSSYTDDPANRVIDAVRLELGDTGPAFELTDTAIAYYLAQTDNAALLGAAVAAEVLSARYAGTLGRARSFGDVSVDDSSRASRYAELAVRLRARVTSSVLTGAIPTAGGLHRDDFVRSDRGLADPYFYEDMDSRTSSGTTR